MTRFYIQFGQIKYKRPALRINEMINTGGTVSKSLYTVMNSDLGMLSNWYMANKLSLNAAKSQYVLFKNNRPIENNYQAMRHP